MKVVVVHRGYGCDTGCCGHCIEVDGEELDGSFQFDHPFDKDKRRYAEEFIKAAGCDPADLVWNECIIVKDHD
jgi:hypothetical protein